MISLTMLRRIHWVLVLTAAMAIAPAMAHAQWITVGPDGGDVRAMAYDPFAPDHILLGTSANQLYLSNDDGNSWMRAARLGNPGEHLVLDNIDFDSQQQGVIYVAAWRLDQEGGDIYRSKDGGKTWTTLPGMHGKSVRSFAVGAADHKILIAGALDGVYRSVDQGDTWVQISPPHHAEIKNVESVAIDPLDSNVIYSGTWHLPWKTTDGGKSWHSIHTGLIVDSDIFSIIIDPQAPQTVYASACSGIYRSDNGGELFRKAQGIPFSARRTRKLKQDPKNRDTVYAGTTEGLWKTMNGGKNWKRITAENVIVNDIIVDPRNPQRVLVATDRSGVMASNDGGETFSASNRGYVYRQVTALLVDRRDPSVLYAGVANDKEYGGFFVSRDGGASWMQMAGGLGGRDVFALQQAADGSLVAGTNDGIFALSQSSSLWRPLNRVTMDKIVKPQRKVGKKTYPAVHATVTSDLHARVYDVDVNGPTWLAATTAGLLASSDAGQSWKMSGNDIHQEFIAVHSAGLMIAAATRTGAIMSVDGGKTWYLAKTPNFITTIYGLTIDSTSTVWLASREGAFRSSDSGDTWSHTLGGLPPIEINSISIDREGHMLATAVNDTDYYQSTNGGHSWRAVQVGWQLRSVTPAAGRYYGATLFDGVVSSAETPRTAESAASGGGSGR